MMNLHFNRTQFETIAEIIPMYGEKEFCSPTRSTVPSLSWLRHELTMVNSLLQNLGISGGCDLYLEYKVDPPLGKGTASHTDLMVLSETSSVAMEMKWTEPRYPTVGKWLSNGLGSQNYNNVLQGWLSLLQKHSRNHLKLADFSTAIYQMVHRAASACEAGADPRLAYVLFEPSPDSKTPPAQTIFDDLSHLWSLLGEPADFPFYLVKIPLFGTGAFDSLIKLPKGNETGVKVRTALYGNNPLFIFKNYSVEKIG